MTKQSETTPNETPGAASAAQQGIPATSGGAVASGVTASSPAEVTTGGHAKTAIVYLVLVGLPALGLFLILRSGGALEAPPVVSGGWQLDATQARACLGLQDDEPLTVQQSGRFLQVRAGSVAAEARLEAGALHTTLRPSLDPARVACAGEAATDAQLHAELHDDTLRGTVAIAGCAPCASVPFTAHRPAREDASH